MSVNEISDWCLNTVRGECQRGKEFNAITEDMSALYDEPIPKEEAIAKLTKGPVGDPAFDLLVDRYRLLVVTTCRLCPLRLGKLPGD